MSGALTMTALWWVPRPALLGCSPQPGARLPSCPSYCGGLFQCTPSPGPMTRWAGEPHKYFLSHSSHTQLNRDLSSFMCVFLCSSVLLSCSPQLWTWCAEIPHCFKVWNEHIIVPRRLTVPAVNVNYFHWCAVVFDFSSCWSLQAKTVQGSERWWRRPLRVRPTRGSSGLTRWDKPQKKTQNTVYCNSSSASVQWRERSAHSLVCVKHHFSMSHVPVKHKNLFVTLLFSSSHCYIIKLAVNNSPPLLASAASILLFHALICKWTNTVKCTFFVKTVKNIYFTVAGANVISTSSGRVSYAVDIMSSQWFSQAQWLQCLEKTVQCNFSHILREAN